MAQYDTFRDKSKKYYLTQQILKAKIQSQIKFLKSTNHPEILANIYKLEKSEISEAVSSRHYFDNYAKLIDDYLNWGQEILDDEEIQFEPINKKKINITRTSFDHLSKFSDRSYEDQVTLKGEVLEADVKQKRFQLWIDDKTKIQINFSDEQETEVTTALKEHKNLFLEVRGTGEFYPSGKIKFIRLVERLQITPKSEKLERKPSKKIGDIFDQFSSKVPPEEWNKLPKDLNENLDHYIYRMPKR
ncbi:MAG: hypothetical protein IH886_15565 [Nitrospinae bacterium]|nr:hypothetical protein [Nitrospinota bacterium]